MATVAYRTSRPLRRLLFLAGSALVVLMVLWGALRVLDAFSIREKHSVRSYAGVASVDLRHAHGDVAVTPARGERVRVTIDSRTGYFGGHSRSAEVVAGELRLRGGCRFVAIGTCDEDYRIEVPDGTAVRVRTSAGDAVAIGVRGDVELRSRAGRVRAVDVRGRELRLRSSAGEVDVERSAAQTVEARTSAGGVDVELTRPPLSLTASSSAGGVTVRVPDVGYDVEADTSAGDESIRIRQRPASRRSIRVDSSAGDVTVLPLARPRRSGD